MNEQEQQPVNEPYGSHYSMQANNEVNEKLVRYLTDPREILILIENDLRGKTLNLTTGEWSQTTKPAMNDEGIREIMNVVLVHFSPVTTLSTFSEEQIAVLCEDLHCDIAYVLGTQYRRFEVRKDDRALMVTKIMNPVFASYKRATNGLTLNIIGKSTRESFIQNSSDSGKRKGLLGSWFK